MHFIQLDKVGKWTRFYSNGLMRNDDHRLPPKSNFNDTNAALTPDEMKVRNLQAFVGLVAVTVFVVASRCADSCKEKIFKLVDSSTKFQNFQK